jgi:hypothetical protein
MRLFGSFFELNFDLKWAECLLGLDREATGTFVVVTVVSLMERILLGQLYRIL